MRTNAIGRGRAVDTAAPVAYPAFARFFNLATRDASEGAKTPERAYFDILGRWRR